MREAPYLSSKEMIQNVEYSFLGYLFNVFRLFGFTSAYDFLGSLKDVVEVKFLNIKALPTHPTPGATSWWPRVAGWQA